MQALVADEVRGDEVASPGGLLCRVELDHRRRNDVEVLDLMFGWLVFERDDVTVSGERENRKAPSNPASSYSSSSSSDSLLLLGERFLRLLLRFFLLAAVVLALLLLVIDARRVGVEAAEAVVEVDCEWVRALEEDETANSTEVSEATEALVEELCVRE